MRVRWYGLNILMVGLAATQALVAVFHYALYADAHLLLAVKIIRELQNIIAFAVYARLACESSDKQHAVRRMVWPGLGVLIAFLLAMLVVGMLRKKLDCHDPIWLLVTGSNTVLTGARRPCAHRRTCAAAHAACAWQWRSRSWPLWSCATFSRRPPSSGSTPN